MTTSEWREYADWTQVHFAKPVSQESHSDQHWANGVMRDAIRLFQRYPPKAALAFGIAFNELATNAVKYGAFSNATGSVDIEWKIEPRADGPRLILHWREKDGPTVTPPLRRGFGSRVIERGLAYELEGAVHLQYRTEGLVCTMDIPAPAPRNG